MNRVTRALAVSGVAVAAGLTMAAGPALGSPSAPAAPVAVSPADQPGATTQVVRQPKFRERIHDYYRSPRTCHRVGRAGVWQERWVRYQCFQVWRGFHRGDWALKVYYGWNFKHRDFHDGHDNSHHGDRGWPSRGNDWQKH
jgi:hypothetical protein